MADLGNSLILAWHGVDGDDRIWQARMTPTGGDVLTWDANSAFGRSTDGPAIGYDGGRAPELAWKGAKGGGIHLGSAPKKTLSGPDGPFEASARPALTKLDNGDLLLAWRKPDAGLAWSLLADETGGVEQPALSQTSHAPALANSGNSANLVWKGPDDDVQIYGAFFSGGSWRGPVALQPSDGAILTSDAPSVCVGRTFGLVMAWKGVPGDDRIWWSRYHDEHWETPHEATPKDGAILTSHGPAIVQWTRGLTLAWKGVQGDQQLWWSTFDTDALLWETPQVIDPSDNSNAGPALGTYTVGTL
jgi:hypothetical protein